jgi:hypothetical protein
MPELGRTALCRGREVTRPTAIMPPSWLTDAIDVVDGARSQRGRRAGYTGGRDVKLLQALPVASSWRAP